MESPLVSSCSPDPASVPLPKTQWFRTMVRTLEVLAHSETRHVVIADAALAAMMGVAPGRSWWTFARRRLRELGVESWYQRGQGTLYQLREEPISGHELTETGVCTLTGARVARIARVARMPLLVESGGRSNRPGYQQSEGPAVAAASPSGTDPNREVIEPDATSYIKRSRGSKHIFSDLLHTPPAASAGICGVSWVLPGHVASAPSYVSSNDLQLLTGEPDRALSAREQVPLNARDARDARAGSVTPNTPRETDYRFSDLKPSSSSSPVKPTTTATAEQLEIVRALRDARVRNTRRALQVEGISVELVRHAATLVRRSGLRDSGDGANPGLFGHQVLEALTSGHAAMDLAECRRRRVTPATPIDDEAQRRRLQAETLAQLQRERAERGK